MSEPETLLELVERLDAEPRCFHIHQCCFPTEEWPRILRAVRALVSYAVDAASDCRIADSMLERLDREE